MSLAFGEKISFIRENKLQVSQAQLAKEIGVSDVTLGKWERGGGHISSKNLYKLLETYQKLNAFEEGKEQFEANELWRLSRISQKFPTDWFTKLLSNRKSRATSLTQVVSSELMTQIQGYIMRQLDDFDVYDDPARIIPLLTKQGNLAPVTIPAPAMRGRFIKMIHMLEPHFVQRATSKNLNREISVEEFLNENTCIVLLGAPGAGKSTTLRRLFRQYSTIWLNTKQTPFATEQAILPIYVALSSWDNPKWKLEEFLEKKVVPELADQILSLLEVGNVLLLLDGLNELPGLKREENTQKISDERSDIIEALAHKRKTWKVSCLLTCREKDFAGGPLWHDLHVQNLTRPQVEDFARAYYEGDPEMEELVRTLIHELYDGSDERKQKLQGLAEQPFYLVRLLTYYYTVYRGEGIKSLPENPAKLIQVSVEDALKREYNSETSYLPTMTKEEATELESRLALLAFNMTDARKSGTVDYNLATAWLFELRKKHPDDIFVSYTEPTAVEKDFEHAKQIWKQAERANLLIQTDDGIRFYHELIQEYLCARYCQQQPFTSEWLERIVSDVSGQVWFLWHGLDKDLIAKFLEVVNTGDETSRSYSIQALGRIKSPQAVQPLLNIFDKYPNNRSNIIEALGEIGEEEAVPLLIRVLNVRDANLREVSAQALGKIRDDRAIKPLISALATCNRGVRDKIEEAIAKFGNKATAHLINALEDKNVNIRSSSTTTLHKIKDSQANEYLLKVVLDFNEAPYIRLEAANAIRATIGDAEFTQIEAKIAKEAWDFYEEDYMPYWEGFYEDMMAAQYESYYEGLKDEGYI